MEIQNVYFIEGVVGEKEILIDGVPQVAFIGRSNVGKSSTLNALLGRKNMVKVGKTPGKTKEINFFDLELQGCKEKLYFVDLPGYGYAKLSKKDRQKLEELIFWYLEHPVSDLALVVIIIDAKVGLSDFDKLMVERMHELDRDFIIAVNKIDKINQKTQNQLQKELERELAGLRRGENIFYYSAARNKNVHRLREAIFSRIFN